MAASGLHVPQSLQDVVATRAATPVNPSTGTGDTPAGLPPPALRVSATSYLALGCALIQAAHRQLPAADVNPRQADEYCRSGKPPPNPVNTEQGPIIVESGALIETMPALARPCYIS